MAERWWLCLCHRWDLARALSGSVGGGPLLREQFTQGGRVRAAGWEPLEDVPQQVGLGIHAVVTGAYEQAVEHCAAITSFRAAHKEPVLFAHSAGTDVALDPVVAVLLLPVGKVGFCLSGQQTLSMQAGQGCHRVSGYV